MLRVCTCVQWACMLQTPQLSQHAEAYNDVTDLSCCMVLYTDASSNPCCYALHTRPEQQAATILQHAVTQFGFMRPHCTENGDM
jgi:hypothetical protein